MPAVYIPATSSLPMFQTSTQPDQVAVNDVPRSDSTFYISPSSHTTFAGYSLTHVQQTDRDYSGADTVRNIRGGLRTDIRVDNNDPTYTPINIVAAGYRSNIYSGFSGPSYGTAINFIAQVFVQQAPSPHGNEYACYFGTINAGTYDAPISGGNYWHHDEALHGPMAGAPGRFVGYSLVTNNFWNGSPAFGKSAAISLQTAPKIGGANNLTCQGGIQANVSATNYPVDMAIHISGYATGGTGDGFTNAIQIGGYGPVWIDPTLPAPFTSYGGDLGQFARGVVVRAKTAGPSVARLGAFVSEAIGEPGGLILGLDTNDANRVSLYRSANGAATLNGNLAITGGLTAPQRVGIITADTDAATITFNLLTSDWHSVTLGGARTLALSNPTVGQQFSIILKQDATGSRTVTWFGGILWPGGTVPTLTTAANKSDVFTFKCISSGVYLGFVAGQGF